LRRHLGRVAEGVVVPGIGHEFRPAAREVVESCRKRYGLEAPYLLSVAAWEPRKNLALLTESFLDLKLQGHLPGHRLVLAGQEARRGMDDLRSLLRRDGGRDVVSLGYVPDADLPALYSGADALVLASSYEGFGMPVMEARACGTRVVATDIPELHEAGGDEATYVQPTRAGIREGILAALAGARPGSRSVLPTWDRGAGILARTLAGTAPAPS
jgi:glycosyltransferase involved in cell wall biosynthesis